MTLDQCITILTEHSQWRKAEPPYENQHDSPHTPSEIGSAIDYAIEELHRLKGLEK